MFNMKPILFEFGGNGKQNIVISFSDQSDLSYHILCLFLVQMILPGVSCVLITDKNRTFLISVIPPPAQCLAFMLN